MPEKQDENENVYDQHFKSVIHRGTFLSWILKGCIDELKDRTIDEIKNGLRIGADGFTVIGRDTEIVSPRAGPIRLDSLFDLILPDTDITVFVNVEAQNPDSHYAMEKRAEYYVCTMIHDQKGTVFRNDDYDKMCKVYSIWLMMDPLAGERSTVRRYWIAHDNGGGHGGRNDMEEFNVIFMNLGGTYGDKMPEELEFMTLLFGKGMTENERMKIAIDKYKITQEEYPSEDLREMSVFYEDTKARFLEEGGARERVRQQISIAVFLIKEESYSLDRALRAVKPLDDEREEVIDGINEALTKAA